MRLLILIIIPFSLLGKNLELTKFYLDFGKSISTNRDFTIPKGEQKKGTLGLMFNLNIFKYIYSKTEVDSFYTNKQFRYVSLTKELGFKVVNSFEFYIKHKSEHALDFSYKTKYPNGNSVGIRLKIVDKER